ncbi:MAG: hypothetical protein ABSA15_00175 [Thermoplasmata archaeon]
MTAEVDPPGAPAEEWSSAVRVEEDAALERELAVRLRTASGARAISVTDLTNLRVAFWRRRVPLAKPPEVQARLDAGARWHLWLGAQLGPRTALEVRVRREGIIGQIDALTDVPIELKTTGGPVNVGDLPRSRPDYVEQLGMYCGLLGHAVGRLSVLVTRGDELLDAHVVDIAFRDPAALWAETLRRAGLLGEAWENGRPDGLPRCTWFDRGCEFQREGVCGCTGSEGGGPSPILDGLEGIVEDREAGANWRAAAEIRGERTPPVIERFRDLLYPRRAYFERTRPAAPGDAPDRPLAGSDPVRNRVAEALESGTPGELARRAPRTDEPEEAIPVYRGLPYLLRAWRTRTLPLAEEVRVRHPQYAIELGFRCAALGESAARLFLAGQPEGAGPVPLRAFTYTFEPITRFSRLWRERARDLARSLSDTDPARLAACPAWMARDCRFQPECGCPAEPGRAQR